VIAVTPAVKVLSVFITVKRPGVNATLFPGSLFSTTREAEKRDPGNEVGVNVANINTINDISITNISKRNSRLLSTPASSGEGNNFRYAATS